MAVNEMEVGRGGGGCEKEKKKGRMSLEACRMVQETMEVRRRIAWPIVLVPGPRFRPGDGPSLVHHVFNVT
jgi:hypothetical protein